METKLGNAIRARRKKLGLSIEELAKKIKTHRTYISKIENQGFIPSDKLMGKIVKGLDAPTLIKIYLTEKHTEILKKSKN